MDKTINEGGIMPEDVAPANSAPDSAPQIATLQELSKQEQKVWHDAQAWLDDNPKEGEGWSEEQATIWQRYNNELDTLGEKRALYEKRREAQWRTNDLQVEQAAMRTFRQTSDSVDSTPDLYREAWYAWAKGGNEAVANMAPEYREAWQTSPVTTTTGTAGGNAGDTIPTDLANLLTVRIADISAVDAFARVVTTDSGNAVDYPVVEDTSNSGRLVAEMGDKNANAVAPTFSKITLNSYKASSDLIPVSAEILEDTGIADFEQMLVDLLAHRVGNRQGQWFTSGTGSSQPQGYSTATSVSDNDIPFAGGATATKTLDNPTPFYSLPEQIKAQYDSNAMFTISRPLLGSLRALSVGSADNRPLWQPGFASGEPNTIMGYPYVVNVHLPTAAIANDAVIGTFGDHSGFLVRRVRNLKFVRDVSIYVKEDAIAFGVSQRVDSEVINTESYRRLLVQSN